MSADQQPEPAEDPAITTLRGALQAAPCRIEMSFAFGPSGVVQTATVWRKNARNRWEKASPLLLAPDGSTNQRADLLHMLAELAS